MSRHRYELIVGNVGTVYNGGSRQEAVRWFKDYVNTSENCMGARCYCEDVTVMSSVNYPSPRVDSPVWLPKAYRRPSPS